MKRIISALLVLSVLAVSCKKDHDNGIFRGPDVTLHNGKAWTWIQVDDRGNPERLGVTINDAAMNSLPIGGESGHNSMEDNNIVLPLHPKASNTLFNHVWLNWNPAGHEPPGIYDLPHFDFHFYMVSHDEVMNSVDDAKLNAKPAQDYFPTNYVAGPPVPMMGLHWIDVTSPELNGQKFTQTFILGSYDSKVTFYEPMITKEFLVNTTQFERNIPVPAKFQKTGYYPTKMRVVKHDGVTEVILDGFVRRQAS